MEYFHHTNKATEYDVLSKPLTTNEINKQLDTLGFVQAVIPVYKSTVFDNSYNNLLDIFEELLVGNNMISGVHDKIVGMSDDGSILHFQITVDDVEVFFLDVLT